MTDKCVWILAVWERASSLSNFKVNVSEKKLSPKLLPLIPHYVCVAYLVSTLQAACWHLTHGSWRHLRCHRYLIRHNCNNGLARWAGPTWLDLIQSSAPEGPMYSLVNWELLTQVRSTLFVCLALTECLIKPLFTLQSAFCTKTICYNSVTLKCIFFYDLKTKLCLQVLWSSFDFLPKCIILILSTTNFRHHLKWYAIMALK